jgi:hypothetical protein
LVPFLVLLAGVGQTVIFAEVGGISKAQLELAAPTLARRPDPQNLGAVGCARASVAKPRADIYDSVLGIYRKSTFSCQIYENKGAVFEIPW